MKSKIYMKKIVITLAVIFCNLLVFIQTNAQCEKKKFCKENLGDYDYRSQSSYAEL